MPKNIKTATGKHPQQSIRDFGLIQHNLIPWSLVTMNIVLAHLIYWAAMKAFDLHLLSISILAVLMVTGIILRNKYLMIASNSGYWIFLIFSLFFVA
ncbi:hypothetical protein [Pedobacter sp. BAL39]|uniref:hypothetical protein n=1 Tax=Pedobacter sp. BAL39 TaxID=391596 RepID=UPI0012FA20CB|nr:hypothetical protein [Pedobacter sp. BAL39]